MNETLEYGVLGGGLAGLLVGDELKKRGCSFLVLESEPQPGGLMRCLDRMGIPGDMGPHALYSKNQRVISWLKSLPLRYDVHRRKVRVVHHGSDDRVHEVDYPFENGIGDLPLPEKVACLEGYINARLQNRSSFHDLKDWIDNGLGEGIARNFMIPYNRKIWNAPLEAISMDLVNKKIEPAPVRVIIESALGVRTVGRKVQSVFLYPRGGIQAVAQVLARRLGERLVLGSPVQAIRKQAGIYVVRTPQGERRFERLISTIPLKDLLRLLPFPELRRHRRVMANNDTLFVSVALKKGRKFRRFADCHWLFFAGPEVFYRVNMMHLFFRSPFQHLVAEVTWKGPVRLLERRQLEARVLQGLKDTGILGSRSDVAAVELRLVPCTYPIPTLGLNETIKTLDEELGWRGISLIGRNGHWEYLNMDQVIEKVWSFFSRWPQGRRQARARRGRPN